MGEHPPDVAREAGSDDIVRRPVQHRVGEECELRRVVLEVRVQIDHGSRVQRRRHVEAAPHGGAEPAIPGLRDHECAGVVGQPT
jgi:hypothetical protein